MINKIDIIDLGTASYKQIYFLQKKIVDEIKLGLGEERLIFCEHYPVITLGRTGKIENLLVDINRLKKERIEFFKIDRGGDISAHEPGQLTVYPIFDLKRDFKPDIHLYLNNLQQVILSALSDFDINGEIIKDKTGVWIGDKKIASIGIAISHWITYHGLSININNDLRTFSFIRPCGMDIEMTSLARELGEQVALDSFKQAVIDKFSQIFKINFYAQAHP